MAIHYFIERSLKTPLSIQVMNAILVLFTLLSITEAFTSISGISTLRPSESKLFMGTDEETKAAANHDDDSRQQQQLSTCSSLVSATGSRMRFVCCFVLRTPCSAVSHQSLS